jgi:excisionase family DNA binding protein
LSSEILENGQIIDVHQAAEVLGYHEETLRRMTREGRVPAFRIGRKWHYDRKVLARWMADHLAQEHQRHVALEAPLVLVVDDETDLCEVYARILTRAGFRVKTAAGGAEAIALLDENLPDLLITDQLMPRVNGIEVLAHARSKAPHLPVIISTGYPDSDLLAKALEHGAFTLLAKPVTQGQLLDAAVMLTKKPQVQT